MGVLIAMAVSIGGLAEIVPLMADHAWRSNRPRASSPIRRCSWKGATSTSAKAAIPATRRWCVRSAPRPSATAATRWPVRSVYDHPFQFGSKRTGPDLARVGGRYSDEWHRVHLMNPRDLVPESNMPAFPWLADTEINADRTGGKMKALRMVGVPYTDSDISIALPRQ